MADDNHSSYGGRRKPQFRGPFVVTNPNNDSDDENVDRSHYISPYVPPPLPSTNPPTTHSPYPQQPQPISTQGGSSSNKNSYEHIHVVAPPNGSNPSLSSPSGSSSPNVESTPPPSTPGLSTQYPTVAADDAMSTTDRFTGPMLDSRNDVRQYDAGARMTMMDKFKQHLPAPLRRNVGGTRVMPVRPLFTFPVYLTLLIICYSLQLLRTMFPPPPRTLSMERSYLPSPLTVRTSHISISRALGMQL